MNHPHRRCNHRNCHRGHRTRHHLQSRRWCPPVAARKLSLCAACSIWAERACVRPTEEVGLWYGVPTSGGDGCILRECIVHRHPIERRVMSGCTMRHRHRTHGVGFIASRWHYVPQVSAGLLGGGGDVERSEGGRGVLLWIRIAITRVAVTFSIAWKTNISLHKSRGAYAALVKQKK